ncbi:MAG: alpha/beta hydrolase [Gammaproteobacteria bacterium]|jgi:pimeloyl-ACP methyl ester carboxylesterase|nr:alpha/beta hydrolase [Gammaproteobacteria bacterium]MDG2434895.1 alpha/beta hydrolase [Gammaproteobacteria bacterium]
MKKIILIALILHSKLAFSDALFDSLLTNLNTPLTQISFIQKSTSSTDNVAINYYEKGNGPKVLVFIHGYSCNSNYWWAQLEHFSKTFKVISVDLGGHGLSGQNRTDYNMSQFGQDVVAVMDHANINEAILIGHSMGGPVAVEAAVILKDRVRAIIGIDTLHDIAKEPASTFVKLMVGTMFRFSQESATEKATAGFFIESTNKDLSNWIKAGSRNAPVEASRGSLKSLLGMDYPEQLSKINIPIKTLNSLYFRETKVESNLKQYENLTIEFKENVGHFIMMEQPTSFNLWLEDTLKVLNY